MRELPSAGWYLDPDDNSMLRWWDGADWCEQRATAAGYHDVARREDSTRRPPSLGTDEQQRVMDATDAVARAALKDLGTLHFRDFWSAIYTLWVTGAAVYVTGLATAILTQRHWLGLLVGSAVGTRMLTQAVRTSGRM